jgi:hypothetical protein
MMAGLAWKPISGKCGRCFATGACFECGAAIACRFSSGGQGRIHVGKPPTSSTYALFNVTADTPDFPGARHEFTTLSGRR